MAMRPESWAALPRRNPFLDGQNPVYGIGSGGDYDAFVLDGANLTLTATPTKSLYTVNVTSAGGFGSDNSRTIDVEILGYNAPPSVQGRSRPDGHRGRYGDPGRDGHRPG